MVWSIMDEAAFRKTAVLVARSASNGKAPASALHSVQGKKAAATEFALLRHRSTSQGLVVQRGVAIRFFAFDIGRLWSAQHVQHSRAFPINAYVGLRFQLKGYVLVTHGTHQHAVGGATLRREHVEAHDALTTH